MVGTDAGTERSVAVIDTTGTSEAPLIGTTSPNRNSLAWPSRIVIVSLFCYALATMGYLYEVAQYAMSEADTRFGTIVKLATGELLTSGSALQSIFLLTAIVASLIWQYRAATNVAIFDIRKQAISPARAIGWWFVPIMFFYKPAVSVSQLWRMSSAGVDWETTPSPNRLLVWWLSFWVSIALTLLVLSASVTASNLAASGSTNQERLMQFVSLVYIAEVASLVPVAFWWNIVHCISLNQLNPRLWAQEVVSSSARPSDASLPTSVPAEEAELTSAHSLRATFETSQSPSKTNGDWSWLQKGATAAAFTALFVAMRIAGTGLGVNSAAHSGWQYTIEKDAITDRFNYRLEGTSVSVDGATLAIAMGFNCSRETVQAYIDFHVPLEDAFPKGDVNMVAVNVRLDDADAHTLGFVPTSDWKSVVSLRDGFAGGLTGFIASLSSGILPESQTLDAVWKPKDLARAMADSRKLLVRARTRNGGAVTGMFDLKNYNAEYSRWPCRY